MWITDGSSVARASRPPNATQQHRAPNRMTYSCSITFMKILFRLFRRLSFLCALVAMAQFASANTERWIGVSGVSATTNWSDNANWSNISGGGGPGYTNNDLLFGNEGAAATDITI